MLKKRRVPWWRLSRHLLVFGASILGTAVFCAYLITVRQEDRLVFRIVQHRAAVLAGASAGPPNLQSDFGFIARSAGDRDRLPERLRTLEPGYHLLAGTDEIEHVLVRDENRARIYAVYGDRIHRQRVQSQLRMLLALVAVLGAGTVVLSNWWAGALIGLRPGARRRIERHRPADPPQDIAGDPQAHLALSYGEYQDAMVATRQREREFIANVGHELRTPITLVLTSCELLAENASLDDAAQRQLRRIATATEHMNESVRSFMILARDGSFGEVELVELRACVLEALEPHAQEIQERRLSVQVHVGIEATIEANREAVFVVVSNLVKNAVKYTARGGISIHHLGHTLYVTDTGCGIADGDLPQLFLPFFRTKAAAESGLPGLGLGLAIVKRICDFYGWSVVARSTPGQGTTMSIEFNRPTSLF